jgi:hypothetical protein
MTSPPSGRTSRLTDAIYHGGSMADVHRIADRFVDLLAEHLRGP